MVGHLFLSTPTTTIEAPDSVITPGRYCTESGKRLEITAAGAQSSTGRNTFTTSGTNATGANAIEVCATWLTANTRRWEYNGFIDSYE
jgi:hypothetical protein